MADKNPPKNRTNPKSNTSVIPAQTNATAIDDQQDTLQMIFSNADFPPLPIDASQPLTGGVQNPTTSTSTKKKRPVVIPKLYNSINPFRTENSDESCRMPPTQPLLTRPTTDSTNLGRASAGHSENRNMKTQSSIIYSSNTKKEKRDNLSVQQKPPTAVAAAAPPPPPPTLTQNENKIYENLCEIILFMNKNKEFVCRERVEQEIFRLYGVGSWRDLRVHPSKFVALMNLSERQKSVTFYLHVFEQVFNLCTIHDVGPLIARFMKVEQYDDLRLGPLEKNPEVRRIFGYDPVDCDQPIPTITTGDIIKTYVEFQKRHRGRQRPPLDVFLEFLVTKYQLQSNAELGLFCRSYPYLIQVTGNVKQDLTSYEEEVYEQVREELIEDFHKTIAEFKEKMNNELEFEHIHLRENALLGCLLNLSIYLGTLEKPEVFVAELKQLLGYQESSSSTQSIMMSDLAMLMSEKISKKDKRIINSMLKGQQNSPLSHPNMDIDEQMTTTATDMPHAPINPSFAISFSSSYDQITKIVVSFGQLCSDIYEHLIHYDTPLTIEQLLKVDEAICKQYDAKSFSEFGFSDYVDVDSPDNFLSFLETYRQDIDPDNQLSVYEEIKSTNDQIQLYSFVHQLTMMNTNEINETSQLQQRQVTHGHINAEQIHISDENLSAIEKAVRHKFSGLNYYRMGKQIIKKAKQRFHKNKHTIIHFEESVLDLNGLNQLNTCPISVNINENQLCQLILHCPLMINLHTWLQWLDFFQPKHGTLQSFITKHEDEFKSLQLLEISTGELYRLPINATLATFEHELDLMHIRSAVGHLCALIIQEGLIKRFPINVYRTSMDTWFRHLRSAATLQNDHIDPLKHILTFLMHLPTIIGQSRIIEELILVPLDKLFDDPLDNKINPRAKLWNLANAQERIKLEVWGHTLNIVEWKNEKKWSGDLELEEEYVNNLEHSSIQSQISNTANPSVITMTTTESLKKETTEATSNIYIPSATTDSKVDGDADSDLTQAAFQHVESIRRGFGVDNNLDAASQAIITNLLGMVDRSLKRLSTDLYVEQGHFVLELIQNADDNQYKSGIIPTLCFKHSLERILVCNNEIGFQPENITAICNVGASTKGKHKQGFAGHKGIGFKSVFVVSHRPEIHSRNYHICFDTGEGNDQIGYALPIWLDKYEEVLPSPDEWTTCLRLPIKKDAQDARIKDNFNRIESIFLLFLNRLKKIEIINQYDMSITNHNTRTFIRIDHIQGQIIELQEHTTNGTVTSNLWLVVNKALDVPNDIKKKLRDVKTDVNTTIIAIAYPINQIQDVSSFNPPTRPVFAYLPLCSYGFRFILQADFEVPANRQEILHDNLWNEWLKSEMASLIPLAYSQFQHLAELLESSPFYEQLQSSLTPIKIIKFFLKFFPSQNESKPFFNRFVDKSIQLLMGILKLPVSHCNENGETVIDWVSPSQCIILQDQSIRKILSQDLLLSHFNSYYVHEELAQECDEQILLKLGCRQLDFSDITKLIELSYKENEQQHLKTKEAIEQIAQWLACLDYSIQQQREELNYKQREKEIIAKLRKLKIIPLKDYAHLVSVEEFDKYPISFPLDKTTAYAKHLRLVLDDVPRLDEQLINFIEDKYPRRVDSIQRLLENFGIKSSAPNFREIYRHHMLPIMADEKRWSSKSESVLIAYLLCIYEYLYSPDTIKFENEFNILNKIMIIKTHTNKLVSLGSRDVFVHLTSKYGVKNTLENLNLSNHELLFIADDYIVEFSKMSLNRNSHGVDEFVNFFKKLNIDNALLVTKSETNFVKVAELANTQWAYLNRSLSEKFYDPFLIEDYSCDEFDRIITSSGGSPKINIELCTKLLQHLEYRFQHYKQYYVGSVMLLRPHKFGHSTPIQAIQSTFCLSLRQHAWIPVDGDILLKPTEVYSIQNQNSTSAFRRYVPHIKVQVNDEEFIHNILGIRREVEPRTMFELLMKWSCNLDSNSLWDLVNQTNASDIIPCTLPKTFRQSCRDSVDSFREIYSFLAAVDTTRNLLSRFSLWPIVFIPRNQDTGDFIFVEQIFWKDPATLLSLHDTIVDSSGRIPIESYYDGSDILKSLFIDILHVELNPRIDEYLPLLANQQDINKIWQIIEIITKLAIEQNKQSEVLDKCRDVAFIPCIDNKLKLVKYIDRPYYPDDNEISNTFSDVLSIIRLPGYKISVCIQEQFRLLFKIDLLSKVVQTRVIVENEQPSSSLLDFYSSCIDLIQMHLLNQQLISSDRSTYLSTVFIRMQFVCVNHIDLSYSFGDEISRSASKNNIRDTYIDEKSSKFYILKKYENSEMRYINAMVEFIVKDEANQQNLSNHIQKLLRMYQNEGEKYLAQQREKMVNKHEPKWIIPKVVEQVTPTLPDVPIERPVEKVSLQEIEKLKEESSIRPVNLPKAVTKEGTKEQTSYPLNARASETIERKVLHMPNQPMANSAIENKNTSSLVQSDCQNKNQYSNEQVFSTVKTDQDETVSSSGQKSNNAENKPTNLIDRGPLTPPSFSNPIVPDLTEFKRVTVSNLTNIDLVNLVKTDESSDTNVVHPTATDADQITGRLGEELVFYYLKNQYPNDEVTWINQTAEYGKPYDIHLIVKSENNREEFIEVKTTRLTDQNSFPVSIGEIKYLIKHPSNYYIYRVYYADNIGSSTITIMNQITSNLEEKRLKLLMTYNSILNK